MQKEILPFLKAQLSAFIGGIVDYGIMIVCKELLGFDVRWSIRISGSIGAVVNFSINRWWAFKADEKPIGHQLWKFVIVVIGSIILKSEGTNLLTSLTKIDYKITRLMVELIVSLGFNYVLQRFWVFRKAATE